MLLGGVQRWFDAPVVARFVSNAVRADKDDVLSKIDAIMGWRWCSPTCKRGLGRAGIGPQDYDPLVRFKCLLIGQWHPEAGVRALKCGWISCCVAAPTSLHLCPMRRPIAFFAMNLVKGDVEDDLLAGVCRAPQDQAEAEAPDDPPND
ncbi:MAG: hypothetical protein GDA36_05960 [Rhodobacteraceae bacterium]|nr:hypothetical protein [Paracoccaceae bacterium]